MRQTEIAMADVHSDNPERRMAGMRNVIVWCRAVTNALQRLRSVAPDFDDWYGPKQDEMRGDPLLRWLYVQRSEILKAATDPAVSSSLYVRQFGYPSDLPPAPPNATAFFMGDQLGGIGWEVELPDGTREKIYVALPDSIAQTWLHFADAHDSHLGEPIPDPQISTICDLYVGYLSRFVDEARQRFQ